jgi:hypothetical protein
MPNRTPTTQASSSFGSNLPWVIGAKSSRRIAVFSCCHVPLTRECSSRSLGSFRPRRPRKIAVRKAVSELFFWWMFHLLVNTSNICQCPPQHGSAGDKASTGEAPQRTFSFDPRTAILERVQILPKHPFSVTHYPHLLSSTAEQCPSSTEQ